MDGTTLKYQTKGASVERMEASFNSDYDRLLMVAEERATELALAAYTSIFARMGQEGFSIESAIHDLIDEIYNTVDSLFRPWYYGAFEHISRNDLETFAVLYSGVVRAASSNRAIALAPLISRTIERTVVTDDIDGLNRVIEGMSNRTAVTETNGAAGAIVEGTALSMFTEGGLYKRWISVGDERVRFTHQTASRRKPIPSTQLYQVGDVMMRFPADPQAFGGNVAGEVVNCRCRSLILPYTTGQANSTSLNGLLTGL